MVLHNCSAPLPLPVLVSFFFSFFFFIFIYFWLLWVFIAVQGLSLIAVSGCYPLLWAQ